MNILLDMISDFPVLPFEGGDSKIASYIWAKLREGGITIGDADIMISATCIKNREK